MSGTTLRTRDLTHLHVVITRFNVGLDATTSSGEAWLRNRLDLFERFTLPSMASQTVPCDAWLIFCDDGAGSPDWFLKEFEQLLGSAGSVAKIVLEPTFDWSHIAPHVKDLLPEECILLTTRIDNDDAIARDYFESIRAAVRGRREFINFSVGVQYADGRVYRRPDPYNPFITLVESIDSAAMPDTVWKVRHDRAFDLADVRQVRAAPMWLANIHGGNLAQEVMGLRWPATKVLTRFDIASQPTSQKLASTLRDAVHSWTRIIARTLSSPARWRRVLALALGRRQSRVSDANSTRV